MIDVSWCGECPNRGLMNWMWQNKTVMARAQSWFGQALAVTEKSWLVRYWKRNIHGIEFSISLWGHMWALSVQNLFWWTIMPVPTVHTSLTLICNVRQSFVWTGLLDHRTWIRFNMHGTVFRVRFQPDLCNSGLYRGSRMHWLLNGGWFHKTGYRLWLRACAWDVVL